MKDNHHLALWTQASLLFDAHPHLEHQLRSFGNVIISHIVRILIHCHFDIENRKEQLKTTLCVIFAVMITNVSIEADPVILPIEGAGPRTDSSSARAAILD